jgi:hypothetical protein
LTEISGVPAYNPMLNVCSAANRKALINYVKK